MAPNRQVQLQLTLAGGISVFLLVLGTVSYCELRAHRIGGSDDVTQVLGMRVLGSLPIVTAPRRRRLAGPEVRDQGTLLVESTDNIRTMLLCDDNMRDMRMLMVTSAVSREGKTTLASHLASSIARTGMHTLLIDCDFRRPVIHRLFDLPSDVGLSEVLDGTATAAEAIHATAVPGLFILPAGRHSQHAVAALAQGRVAKLLEELRAQFQFIVIDSSPVLPVADGLVLGKLVDAVLLSVRPHVSQTPLVLTACERIASLGIRILGVVVNGAAVGSYDYAHSYIAESPS
jgi:capsular exopolysaccharide synthesis family protein